ncbi:MAG: NADPH-dependent glutamate synthase [Deltaproteobacteria bacterium]|nr:MAG: NADPH-dependent glutamate synthase [Deltaproteobacteria bacterium]
MYQIVHREQFSAHTFLWSVYAPDVAAAARPGQFVMLRLREGGERIPLTIADFDPVRGTVTMVVQALGRTTLEMLRGYEAGDWFRDLVGPLGLPSHLGDGHHVACVGGGLGVAPVYPQLRAAKEAGRRVTAIIGFRTREAIFWEERFRALLTGPDDRLIVCTDDGTAGHAGFVTGPLETLCQGEDRPDRVVAIGPMPMMRAVAEVTRPHGVPTVVSLNVIMVDGTGMCGSCRVSVGPPGQRQIRFACVDGPDFDAHQVDFDELLRRQRRFVRDEERAREDFEHVCNLEQQLVVEGKRNYKKLKVVAPHATAMPERDATERAGNFLEVNLGYGWEQAMAEAERCIQCIRPACVAGCPVGIDIPGFIRKLLLRDLEGALETIHQSNLFPSICGRVCPQENQCEAQCIVGRKLEPVAIGRLERFVGDHAPTPLVERPEPDPDLGRVAIIGSGPAGLACAGDLARAGVEVTVYEALHVIGDVLRYGIPSFRLPRSIIDREIESLQRLGVRFEVDKVIGQTFTIDQLLGDMGYRAAFVATGAGYPTFLGLPGEGAGQVYSANEFLTRVNLMGGDRFPFEDTPVGRIGKVVVIGAGNTAMDCLRVARRLGAEEVHCVYRRSEAEAPARKEELRHAREEGIRFHWLRSPTEILLNADGEVAGLRTQVMQLGEPDASGRRRPVPVDGEEEVFDCDTVIYALGTRANPIIGRSAPDLARNRWGYIVVDEASQATNIRGLFAGGDIVTGGATVILALGAGRRAARAMLRYLRQPDAWPPEMEGEAGGPLAGDGVCPRCHLPIEPGESYVCCAGQTLRFHCLDCHKVYEGQAFPYGRCPACGGRLSLDPGVTGAAVTDPLVVAVREAIEIEIGGAAFYAEGAARAEDAELASLFSRLAAMEEEHLEVLSRRYHAAVPAREELRGAVSGGTWRAVLGQPELPTDGESLLRLALRLEERARDFFASRARDLAEGSTAWKLYRELEAEESEHVAIIQTELRRWRAGAAGML